VSSVLENMSRIFGETVTRLPDAIIKYLFCCPGLDFKFRCLPSAGGFYDQRYRDFVEFTIIESRIRNIQARQARG
jgi:hypothetical protein